MQGARVRTKLANIKHFMQAYMSGALVPKDRLWTYKPILYTELFYGKWVHNISIGSVKF